MSNIIMHGCKADTDKHIIATSVNGSERDYVSWVLATLTIPELYRRSSGSGGQSEGYQHENNDARHYLVHLSENVVVEVFVLAS